jgi:hypothetical protein
VPEPGRDPRRIAVRIDPDVWREEVARLDPRSPARIAAQRERRQLEEQGVALDHLQRCAELGEDRTRLAGLLKAYVPIAGSAPSGRPFGMVFSPEPARY